MKNVFFVLFAFVFAASICFAEQVAAPSTTDNSVNPVKVSGNTTAPEQITKPTIFTGKVESVSNGNSVSGIKPYITVTDIFGTRTAFIIASDTVVIGKDGNPTTFNWIGRTDKVSVEYITDQDGAQVAKSIKVSAEW